MVFSQNDFLLILDYLVMDLKIYSLNVRGLGERLKRRETFNWLRAKQFSIYLLQETHCSENAATTWSSEWGYKTLFSCCSSVSGGVAILFNNDFVFQLEKSYSDPKGRFVICDIKTNQKGFSLWPQSTHQMMTTQPFLRVSLATSKIFIVTI